MDKKIVNRISRQYTLSKEVLDSFIKYDGIVNMDWEGIPNLKDEDYYVEFRDTTGRDIVQQAVNIYSTQRPKWDVLPRGLGDIEIAEQMERIIEWVMWKANQMGRKRFTIESLMHACKYNRVCGQIEWTDDYSFCVKLYHPSTVLFEYGAKLSWVSVVNNVTGASIIEHWSSFYKEDGKDDISKAMKKIEKEVDDDPEVRYMYIDYTDEKRRYTYCYPVSGEQIDESFGYDDDGKAIDGLIVIQDKKNELGFINWAISEGEGDPLLAPLLNGGQYQRINEEETLLRTKAFRTALAPTILQTGREDADAEVSYQGDTTIIKAPNGARLEKWQADTIDPAFATLTSIDRNLITQSLGISSTSTLEASNVQNSTLRQLASLRLAQLDQYKQVVEQFNVQLAYLVFKWAKKKDKVLKGSVLRDSKGSGGIDYKQGTEIQIEPDDIVLDSLYITCKIMRNLEDDKMVTANFITMMKQAEIPIPSSQLIEMFDWGSPEILNEEYEKEQIRKASLGITLQKMQRELEEEFQKRMKEFDAQLQMQMQQASQQMMAQAQGAVPMEGQAGAVAPQQGVPLPSDQMMQGQGFNAAAGGTPPQGASEITQGMR